jgi:hypothetical protein
LGPAFTLPAAPQRLIFARRGAAHPALLWLSGFVCLLLLAWPSV